MTYIFKEHVKILEIYMVKFNTILHCITGKKLLQIGPHFRDNVKKTPPKIGSKSLLVVLMVASKIRTTIAVLSKLTWVM